MTADLFQLEWAAIRGKEPSPGTDEQCEQPDEQEQFYYRLQVIHKINYLAFSFFKIAPKVSTSAKEKSAVEVWKTVYEGVNRFFENLIQN